MKTFKPVKIWKNLLGFLLSLGAAFGGLFLVQSRLAGETERLLADGGQRTVPPQPQVTAQIMDATETTIITQEDHLLRFTEDLKRRETAVLHDPLPGQLSMAEAVKNARAWLEEFFMPGLSAADFRLSEYKTDCYLWAAGRAEGEESPQEEWNPLYSYWNVTLHSRELEASLILNALTGQILEASVVCDLPSAYDAGESLPVLLSGYADSLRPDESYSMLFGTNLTVEAVEKPSAESGGSSEQKGTTVPEGIGSSSEQSRALLYRSVGSQGVLAAVSAESMAAGSPGKPDYEEVLSIRLYLTLESEIQQEEE